MEPLRDSNATKQVNLPPDAVMDIAASAVAHVTLFKLRRVQIMDRVTVCIRKVNLAHQCTYLDPISDCRPASSSAIR